MIAPTTKGGQVVLEVLGHPEFGTYDASDPTALADHPPASETAKEKIETAKTKVDELGLDGTAFWTTVVASLTVGGLITVLRHQLGGDDASS